MFQTIQNILELFYDETVTVPAETSAMAISTTGINRLGINRQPTPSYCTLNYSAIEIHESLLVYLLTYFPPKFPHRFCKTINRSADNFDVQLYLKWGLTFGSLNWPTYVYSCLRTPSPCLPLSLVRPTATSLEFSGRSISYTRQAYIQMAVPLARSGPPWRAQMARKPTESIDNFF